jgi:DNA ligase-1
MEIKGSLTKLVKELKDAGYSNIDISKRYDIPMHWVMIYGSGQSLKSKFTFKDLITYYKSISTMRSIKGKKTEALRYLQDVNLPYKEKLQFLLGELSESSIGVGDDRILEALTIFSNQTREYMTKLVEDYGDIGDIAGFLVPEKDGNLLVDEIYLSISLISKAGAHEKILALASLYEGCSKEEAKYLTWLLKKKIYLGLNSEAIISIVAEYTHTNPELLSNACLLLGLDEGLTKAELGNAELSKVRIIPGQFVEPMLAQVFDSRRVSFPCVAEVKLDGVRVQIHKSGDNLIAFHRSGNVLENYKELAPYIGKINAHSFILEGEIITIDANGKRLPFYDKEKGTPVVFYFDILYVNGKPVIARDYRTRRQMLIELVGNQMITGMSITSHDQLMKYYDAVISAKEEGIMVKDLDSPYYPSRRSTAWMKIKPSTDTIDAVITKAKYGKGNHSGTFSSFALSVRHPTDKILYTIGDIANFTQEDLEMISRKLEIVKRNEKDVIVKPSIILEVTSYEVIESTETTSNYSMRSPRMIRIRWDKSIKDIDTVDKISQMYKMARSSQ